MLCAGELGFAGVLLLPPFYYKNVPDDGVVAYFETVARVTSTHAARMYLYHFPALSGVPFHPALVEELRVCLGSRLRVLKDSSGDMDYARKVAAQSQAFDVFPSTESALMEARDAPLQDESPRPPI